MNRDIPQGITRMEILELVECIARITGMGSLSGFRALHVGLSWKVRNNFLNIGYGINCENTSRLQLALLLRDAEEYPGAFGWSEEDGERPFETILKNALFYAQGRWDMSVVEKCLEKQNQHYEES